MTLHGFTEEEVEYYISKYSKDFIDYEAMRKHPEDERQSTLEGLT